MTYFDAVVLGTLQGLTEFLPVSSSGHLVLAQAILGVKQSGVTFEVLVHLGSLLAVLVYFKSRIMLLLRSLWTKSMTRERKLVLFLIAASVPAGVAGLLLKDFFEQAFSRPVMTSLMLLVTGLILVSTRICRAGRRHVTLRSAVIMGVGQALAILPGISRSGTTISAGMLVGVDPPEAAEFSFLLAIPAILGAVLLKGDELYALDPLLLFKYMAGLVASFVCSVIAVHVVLAAIKRGKFVYFGFYCFAAGAVGLYLFL